MIFEEGTFKKGRGSAQEVQVCTQETDGYLKGLKHMMEQELHLLVRFVWAW